MNGSRVILQDANNDYINASYVDVSWRSSFAFLFCSLLPLRCKLLCCPSEWVSECNNRIRSPNELCRFPSDVPRSLKLPRRRSFLLSTEMLLSYIFGPSVVKYDILSNNRGSKLRAVIDSLFYFYDPPVLHFVSSPESKSWGKNVWTNGSPVVNKNKVDQMCFWGRSWCGTLTSCLLQLLNSMPRFNERGKVLISCSFMFSAKFPNTS